MPFLAQAEAGNVRLARGPWCSDWIDEIVAVPMGAHDDQWDSAAGAFRALTSMGQYDKPGAARYA
jgi:predicted phage terminase large subunit-like protein